MTGNLVFLFSSGAAFSIDTSTLPSGSFIKFGPGFEGASISFGNVVITPISESEILGQKPILEFNKDEPAISPAKGKAAVNTFVIPSPVKIQNMPSTQQQEFISKKPGLPRSVATSQATNSSGPFRRPFQQRMKRIYSFKREAIKSVFKNLLEEPNFELPKPKRVEEIGKMHEPNYCLYHRMLGHVIEDCFSFKDWLEYNYKRGRVMIPDEYLTKPEQGSVKVVTGLSETVVDDSQS